MPALADIQRYWETIRHLRPAQIASRVDLRARAAARSFSPARARQRYARRAAQSGLRLDGNPWRLRDESVRGGHLVSPVDRAAIARAADEIERGIFTFLNDRRDIGWPIDWRAHGAPQLWRYHLHYFDYLPDLLVAGHERLVPGLMSDWIARVPMGDKATRDAWHPYVVSVRLVNWMFAIAAAPSSVEWPADVIASLQTQTLFVADNLETDVGGNHLLKNLKALAMAGCFWSGQRAQELKARHVSEFIRELAGQLRSDGGHYEQSPMYHAQVFGDAIELAFVLRLTDTQLDGAFRGLLTHMDAFLARVCHPDGQLVQFGDTAAGMVADPAALRSAASVLSGSNPGHHLAPRHALLAAPLAPSNSTRPDGTTEVDSTARGQSAHLPTSWDPNSSGFVTLTTEDGRGFLIGDAGPVCPDDLPAHAHSDLLGFEISVAGTRIVVDSGVSEYANGAWRDYYRSTRAHNTVVVDGAEQSECWGSFRVARRARVVDARVVSQPHARGFAAAHTGFDALPAPVRHCRHFWLVDGRFWLLVDELTGSGPHSWSTFLHLHHDVHIDSMASGLIAHRAGASLGIAWFGIAAPTCVAGQREPLQGWYAPAFGVVHAAPTLVSTGSGTLNARFGWVLVPGLTADASLSVSETGRDALTIHVGPHRYDIGLHA